VGVKGGRRVKLTTSPPSVSRLSRENVGNSTSHNRMGSSRPVTGIALPYLSLSSFIHSLMILKHYLWPWPLLQFRNYFLTQSVGLLERVICPSQGRCIHTGQYKHRINAHRHTYLMWDWNPRSQCLRWPRQFMPSIARAL
jgi:hypothetical protein